MDAPELLRGLMVVLGIGLVIFVHELGHFLAARMNGVRVDVFSIGFGPRLLGWRRGATLYQVAAIPIGGFVRMAGEERRGDGVPPAPDELAAKSVGQRFFIYSGGVLMNVLFGLVVFPILFTQGVPFQPPVLGDPLPGSPAWEAGLQEGTEVVSVNGNRVFDFYHVPTEVALGEPDAARLVVRPPGGEATREVVLRPERDPGLGVLSIGVSPALARDEEGRYLLEVEEGSPAWDAGLRPGDRLVSVAGGPPGIGALDRLGLATLAAEPLEIVVARRGDGEADGEGLERTYELRIEPGERDELSPPRIGIRPPQDLVAGIRGDLVPALVPGLRQGDRLLSVAGRPVLRLGDLREALLAALEAEGPGVAVPVRALRGDAVVELEARLASPEEALALADGLALDVARGSTAVVVTPGEPAALAGLRDGDQVLEVDGFVVETWDDLRELVERAGKEDRAAVLSIERAGAAADGPPEYLRVAVAPAPQPIPDYGLGFRQAQYVFRADGPWEAVSFGAYCSWKFAQDTWLTLKRILSRQVPGDNVGGIISIGAISYSWAEAGWTKLFFFLCLLSINLAILNVLPIPVLDGGHLLFLLVEKVKGSPVSDRVLGYSQIVGLVLILSLMVYVTYNDLVRWVPWFRAE